MRATRWTGVRSRSLIAVDDADLGADELKIPGDGVQRAAEIPGRVDQRGSVHNRWPDGPSCAQSVDDLGIDRSLDRSLETLLKHGGELAFDEQAVLVASPLIPAHLPKAESGLVGEIAQASLR